MRATNSPLFNIRPATTDDVSRLGDFAREFLGKMHARATSREARMVYQRVIQHPDLGVLLVAEDRSGICAFAYASYHWRSEFGGEMMNLVELFVEQSARQKGVAASLISKLLDIARDRGIHRIAAEVHPGNSAIERMLESAGFDPQHRTLWGLEI